MTAADPAWTERISDWLAASAFRLSRDSRFLIGSLLLVLMALCFLRVNGWNEGVPDKQAGFGFAAAIWTLVLARTRVRLPLACLLSLYVLLLAIAPFHVGDRFTDLASDFPLARFAYAVTAVLLIEAFSPIATGEGRAETVGGISTGFALATLLVTNYIYCVCGLFLLAALMFGRKQTTMRWAGIAAGFSAALLAMLTYWRFDLSSLWASLHAVPGTYNVDLSGILSGLLTLLSGEAMALIAILLLATVLFWRQGKGKTAVGIGGAGAAVLATGALSIVFNHHDRGLPLNAVMAVLVAGRLLGSPDARPLHDRAIRLCVIALSVLLTIGAMLPELASLPYAALQRRCL